MQMYSIAWKHLISRKMNILTVVLKCREFEVKDIYDVELLYSILGSPKPIRHFRLFLGIMNVGEAHCNAPQRSRTPTLQSLESSFLKTSR